MSQIRFAHPHTLFDSFYDVLKRVGSEKFFSGSQEDIKKAREAFQAYFFTMALKKWTGLDWWVAHYDQAERQFPDFDFFAFEDGPKPIRAEKVELTGVYPHFKTFEEMMTVVEKKKGKYGSEPVDFSLLIFMNHERSEEWIKTLCDRLDSSHPFISIWTVHLLFKPGGQEVQEVVATRIRPTPNPRVVANTDDPDIYKRQKLPEFLEENSVGVERYISFKPGFLEKYLAKIDPPPPVNDADR